MRVANGFDFEREFSEKYFSYPSRSSPRMQEFGVSFFRVHVFFIYLIQELICRFFVHLVCQ